MKRTLFAFAFLFACMCAGATELTSVRLEAFTVQNYGAGLLVSWNTTSEPQNAGFHLYRRKVTSAQMSALDVAWSRVNTSLIPGRSSSAELKEFFFYDWPAPGVYEYLLESVSLNGENENYPQTSGLVVRDPLAPNAACESSVVATTRGSATNAANKRPQAMRHDFQLLPTSFIKIAVSREVKATPQDAGDNTLRLGTVDPDSWNLSTLNPSSDSLNAASSNSSKPTPREASSTAANVND